MRSRAQARTQRFLNARVRTLGIDKEALDAQVEEKRLMKLAEKQAQMDQFAYDQQVLRVLESNEADAKAAKAEEMSKLRDDHLAQAAQPKNSCAKIGDPIDPENCSTGAGQYFAGEDKHKDERIRQQQAQMRQWTRQQIAEKQARDTEVAEDNSRYDQYLASVTDMRAKLEAQEAARVKDNKKLIRMLNEEIAEDKRLNRQQEAALNNELNSMELKHNEEDPFINEETDYGKSAVSDYRVRPDHFKGFSKEQVRHIYKDTEEIAEQQRARRDAEREEEIMWGRHQQAVTRVMEENALKEKEELDYLNKIRKEELELQREHQKQKREEMKRDRFGRIDHGFFQGFGSSCR